MDSGRSEQERRNAQHRAEKSHMGKWKRVVCGCLAAAVPWFRQEDEKMKEKQGIRTGRVMPACHYALSMAVNPRQVVG